MNDFSRAAAAAAILVFAVHAHAQTVAPKAATASAPVPNGKHIYTKWCAACHDPGRHPDTAALAAKYGKDQPAALEMRTDLELDVVKYFVRQGVSIMPPFRKTEITDRKLEALSDYLAHKPVKK